MARKTKTPTKGRPKGATNKPRDQVDGEITRCKRCGSTNREPYMARKEHAYAGLDDDGQPFTHTVWRRTRCSDCGQFRIDRCRENRPKEQPEAKKK